MKNNFALIMMFLFAIIIANSQNNLKDTLKYEIVYDFSFQENKDDSLSIQSEQMVLKVSKNFSYYISSNSLKLQNFYKGINNSNEITKVKSPPKSKFSFTIIKDYVNDKIIYSDMIGLDIYSFDKTINKFNWVLINDETEILGYKCKKATATFAGRDYIAWYAMDINIPDGPYKFHGLPGLIFSIYDTNKHYEFMIYSINKNNAYFDTNDEFFKHIKITEKDFKQLEKKYREKPSSMLNSDGMTFPQELLDKGDRRATEKMKYENNPIELID